MSTLFTTLDTDLEPAFAFIAMFVPDEYGGALAKRAIQLADQPTDDGAAPP